MLYKIPPELLIEFGLLETDHGRFLFEAPPTETAFDHVQEANPRDIIDTCWGTCRNVEGVDDYFGIAVVEKETGKLLQGYYLDVKIPVHEFVSWYTREDQTMPSYDWNLICYVGYYKPEENVLHATDWKEFTIKSPAEKKFPYWILFFAPLALIPILKKFK